MISTLAIFIVFIRPMTPQNREQKPYSRNRHLLYNGTNKMSQIGPKWAEHTDQIGNIDTDRMDSSVDHMVTVRRLP